MFRILRGLLGLKGPVYKLIRHLPPCEVLEALSLIAEEYHNISPGSVSALWENWYKIAYVHGSDISACIKLIRGGAEHLNCDVATACPLLARVLALVLLISCKGVCDAIRSAGGSEFDSEFCLAQTMLDSPTVSRSDLVKFAKACKITGS
jgi:hypothetical protein